MMRVPTGQRLRTWWAGAKKTTSSSKCSKDEGDDPGLQEEEESSHPLLHQHQWWGGGGCAKLQVHWCQHQPWPNIVNTTATVRKGHQRLYFLRRLNSPVSSYVLHLHTPPPLHSDTLKAGIFWPSPQLDNDAFFKIYFIFYFIYLPTGGLLEWNFIVLCNDK